MSNHCHQPSPSFALLAGFLLFAGNAVHAQGIPSILFAETGNAATHGAIEFTRRF